ncbi:hypothetical protein DM793_03140 [Paenarthrobacter nitroguajacolicus]|uniref:VOC family protein n=1 Tax=Paenarthrobacter nitroguajacolicus TaxID=211146 RepID=UPI0015B86353|nr:hypothetical protein [Paenarthrobacter nitroguajacolicus]NWL10299.1 hypothetical protein [Paenarthrobacter nitroguajacolicus]
MNATVTMMFHPTVAVEDLEKARAWFTGLFQKPDIRWEDRYDTSRLAATYPVNYSFFIHVGEVVVDALSPSAHAQGAMKNQNRYRGVKDGMIVLGWYTDDLVGLNSHLRQFGIRTFDQHDNEVMAGASPKSSMADDILVALTDPAEQGYRYEFFELGERHREFYSRKGDPRLRPDWTVPQTSNGDPLGIIRSSHHTFLTKDLDRALKLHRDALGGRIIREGHNEELNADSTYLELAGSVHEFAVPRAGSSLDSRVTTLKDVYFGISFLVDDLDKAESHISDFGIIPKRLNESVSISPEDGYGVQWRFITHTPY